MIANLIGEFFELALLAAIHDAQVHTFRWDGPDARFVSRSPDGVPCAMFIPSGELVAIKRDCRIIVEPVLSVRLRPACCVVSAWTVN